MSKVFFAYSHRDESFRDELETHLAMLKRQGVISTWHDRRIDAGQDVDNTIGEHLETSDIVLLLVSAYFLASDYCYDVEMRRALDRHAAGLAVVIPVILNPCDWQHAPFGRLRATPQDGKPVTKFANIHDAFLQVTQDVRLAAQRLRRTSPEVLPTDSGARAEGQAQVSSETRTSNLRVKKTFSDHERDSFVDESYAYIARFFEESLAELKHRNPGIDIRFRKAGDTSFTASVYVDGRKRAGCRIWQPGRSGLAGDIAYSAAEATLGDSFNESMTAADDGYTMGFETLGLSQFGARKRELLSPHGAAEHLWSMFIAPLQ